jgi:hypothetical protein
LSAYYGLQHARIASNSHFSLLSRFKLLPNMQASAALQSLIAEGHLEQAIELYISLSRQYADTARIEKGLHESARFHTLARQHLEGTISQADYQLVWNQINRATLAIASQVPAAWRHPYEPLATTQGSPESTSQNPPQKSFLERWGLILGLVASLTTILGITLKDLIFPKKETTTRTAQPQSTASPTAQPTVPEKTNSTPVSTEKTQSKTTEKPAASSGSGKTAPSTAGSNGAVTPPKEQPKPAPAENPGPRQPRFRSFGKTVIVDGMERGHDGGDLIMYRNVRTNQILCCYDDGEDFRDGKARVSQNGKYFYIDKNGNRIQ